MIKVIFFLILIHIVCGMFKLSVRKCKPYDDYSINYFRYQYDFKYYHNFGIMKINNLK